MRHLAVAVLAVTSVALFAEAPAALAQDGTVRGVVKDSAGKPIPDADVSIVELHQLARTNDQGAFTFVKLPRGEHEVMIRHIGYNAETIKINVNELAYSYDVTLKAQATMIEGVEISASEKRLRLGIEDFYRRRVRGAGGLFFTRDDIIARNARRTTDMLRNSPNLHVVHTRTGDGVRFSNATKRGGYIPVIWLDGQEVQGMEIDDIPVTDIEGIEVYSGPSTTPAQFSQRSSKDACGTIVVWTRIPGTP